MLIPSQCYTACVDGRNAQTGKPLKYQVIAENAVRQCVETIQEEPKLKFVCY